MKAIVLAYAGLVAVLLCIIYLQHRHKAKVTEKMDEFFHILEDVSIRHQQLEHLKKQPRNSETEKAEKELRATLFAIDSIVRIESYLREDER